MPRHYNSSAGFGTKVNWGSEQKDVVMTLPAYVLKSLLDPNDLFGPSEAAMVALVTCGGRFDPSTNHYEDNVIVTLEPVP